MPAPSASATTPRHRRRFLLAMLYCQLALLVPTDASLEQALQAAPELSPESFLRGGEFGAHPVPRAHLPLAFDAYELPPSTEEQYDEALTPAVDGERGGAGAKQATSASFPPAAAALILQLHSQQQQQVHKQPKQQQPRRLCSIEITSTVPGHCQHLKPIGAACVSGEYMDVLNADCM